MIRKFLPFLILVFSAFGFYWSCRPLEEKSKVENGIPVDCTYTLPNLAEVNQFIMQNPADARLFRIRSQILIDSARYPEALSDAKRALSLDPKDLFNYVVVAKAHRGMGHIDSALSACLTAEKEGFQDPDNYLLIGDLYYLIRQYNNSLDYLNKALKLAPFEPKIYFLKGMTYWENRDTIKAVSNWQTAIEQDPSFADGHIKLATFYITQRKWEIAEQYLRSGYRLRPNDPFINLNMGIFLSLKGFGDSAISFYQKALQVQPNLAQAQANLGLLLSDKRQYEEARILLEKALPSDPKNTTLIYKLAQCNQMTQNWEKAEAGYKQLIKMDLDFVKESEKALEKVLKAKVSTRKDSLK